MDVDADIPADEDDDDDVQVISTLDAAMVDDLAEARQKGTWVKKGAVKKEKSPICRTILQQPHHLQQSRKKKSRAQGFGPPEHGHERLLTLSLRRLTMRRERSALHPRVAEFRFPIFRKRSTSQQRPRSVRPRERGKSSAMQGRRSKHQLSSIIAQKR